ncbi:MAG: SDR family NAD(P)-dependent oxidoreductase [Burkholderiales bacterium]|nr:SDR family NAD(P)-dependent oxidoreductase [Burkholderiales bacterium]
MPQSTSPSAPPRPPQHALVIGASRGIGLALVQHYRAAGSRVTATARDEAGLARLRDLGATAIALDVAQPTSAAALAWQVDGAGFDTVIHNAGVYGPRLAAPNVPTLANFDDVMRSNVYGAMLVLPQLLDALAPQARVALISSRMGSIGGRSDASGWLYRASKAAANSVLRDIATALQGRAICASLHPGWVQTDLGGPNAPITAEASARQLGATIARLTPAQHGGFFDLDGSPIPW